MRRPLFGPIATVGIAIVALAAAVACGNGDDNAVSPPDAGSAAKVDAASADASVSAEAASGAGSATTAASLPTAFVRIAQWSLATPTVDVCVAPTGTAAFDKPLAQAAFAADDDAGVGTFPIVSAYFPVPAGTIDVRLVSGGDCAVPLGPDTKGVALGARAYATFAAVDDPETGGAKLVVLSDDHLAPKAVAVRLFNAAAVAGTVTLGTSALGPLLTGVAFAAALHASGNDAGSGHAIDKNGYASLGPLNADTVWVAPATTGSGAAGNATDAGAGDAGAPDAGPVVLAEAQGVSIAAGAAVTFVLLPAAPVGVVSDAGDAGRPPVATLVECVDNAGTSTAASNCFPVP